MMIRSAPPASASLAERPVPAPAPMIGLPGRDLRAQPRERLVARHAAPPISSCSRSAIACGERGVVDLVVALVHLDVGVERLAQPLEQRLVGLRVVERLARRPRSSTRRAAARRAPSAPWRPESLRPISRPSSRHSSGVVRISVTVGLWT